MALKLFIGVTLSLFHRDQQWQIIVKFNWTSVKQNNILFYRHQNHRTIFGYSYPTVILSVNEYISPPGSYKII